VFLIFHSVGVSFNESQLVSVIIVTGIVIRTTVGEVGVEEVGDNSFIMLVCIAGSVIVLLK